MPAEYANMYPPKGKADNTDAHLPEGKADNNNIHLSGGKTENGDTHLPGGNIEKTTHDIQRTVRAGKHHRGKPVHPAQRQGKGRPLRHH